MQEMDGEVTRDGGGATFSKLGVITIQIEAT